MRTWLKWSALGLVAIVAGMQLFRPARTNPPEDQTRTIYAHEAMTANVSVILKKSCNDCHSFQTIWPWYTNFAPISWIIASHVNEGRAELNFSDWGSYSTQGRGKLLGEICEQSTSREMPGILYTSVHRNTRLSDSDIKSVCAWTNAQMQLTRDGQPSNNQSLKIGFRLPHAVLRDRVSSLQLKMPLRNNDTIVVALTPDAAQQLSTQPGAVSFVQDAFSHLKVIGHTPAAEVLLTKAGIVPDAGVINLGRIASNRI